MGTLHQALIEHHAGVSHATLAWQKPQRDAMKKVEQRVIKQLLQAFIFEEVIPAHLSDEGFVIDCQDAQGQSIQYVAGGRTYLSFGLIRMDQRDVIRIDHLGQRTVAELNQVISEIIRPIPNASKIDAFIDELKRTYMHDVQSQNCQMAYALPAVKYSYDELETYLMDGHPYHPCYKSRVGFSLQDNLKYGVEFAQPIHLVWLAVHHSISSLNQSKHIDFSSFILEQLSLEDIAQFKQEMQQQQLDADQYSWIPVHPWQWENHIVQTLYEELGQHTVVYLGRGSEAYIAQQSLRTLTHLREPHKPYLKLSMSITNTSSSRILAAHTAMNGPLITDWLQALIDQSPIAQALKLSLLREVHASAVDFTKIPSNHAKQTYAAIGSLWRESVHQYLSAKESAIPLNGLGHVQKDGQLLIQPWLDQYGADAWLKQCLKVVIQPILFLLLAEGIGTESHGQNMILVHENGWPTRMILKDFHDGVRFSPEHLTHPEAYPVLHALPAEHAKANRMSFILTDDLNAVRDMSCACLFFVALSDIAMSLAKQQQYDERAFWQAAAQVIIDFQQQYPEHQSRYDKFDVFAEEFCIESLTKRRIFGDADMQLRNVKNPLHAFKAISGAAR